MRAYAHECSCNADKIVVWGNSADGHILGMCCATNGKPTFEDLTMGNADRCSGIQGFVSFYAPSDLYQAELNTYISVKEMYSLTE